MIDLADLGQRVLYHRRRLGLTQTELAERMDRSASWVSQVERGVRGVDRLSVLMFLAEALGTTVADLARELVPDDFDLTPAPAAPYHDDAVLTMVEAAVLLSSTPQAMKKWITAGRFCPIIDLPNGEQRVRYGDLIEWVLSLRSRIEP